MGLAVVAAACGGPAPHAAVRPGAPPATSTSLAAPAGVSHVMVVVLENRERGAVIGDPKAPYL
ncbi:MAG TPA: hypothetical protein VG184_00005, partial [Acidimicrobiales bacterium]|nr:hypothetical protein [Acidimicrobiales bacterium]